MSNHTTPSDTTTTPIDAHRHRWRSRIRSVFLLLLAVVLLPLLATVPARAATPSNPESAVAAVLAQHGISVNGAQTTGGQGTATPGVPTAPSTPTTSAPTAPTTGVAGPTPAATPVTPNTTSSAVPTSPVAATSPASPTSTSDTASQPTNASAADNTSPTDTTSGTDETSGSWSISDTVRAFLTNLDINLNDGPLTGTLSGTTLTVTINEPSAAADRPRRRQPRRHRRFAGHRRGHGDPNPDRKRPGRQRHRRQPRGYHRPLRQHRTRWRGERGPVRQGWHHRRPGAGQHRRPQRHPFLHERICVREHHRHPDQRPHSRSGRIDYREGLDRHPFHR